MSLLRACLLLLPLGGLAQREEVSFSRAWRFHYGPGGDDATYGPGNSWQAAFRPISGCAADAARVYPDPHRITFSDCATACAYDPACMAWVHDPAAAPLTCTHATAGAVCAPAASNATTIGGQRAAATPLQTAYSFAAADLPEAAGWPLVDAPHDALMALNGSFCESCGDARHGYRHRTVAWYRKAFFLPAEWAGAGAGATFLRFEGVMHFAQLWLNGVYLGAHASAYGEFVVRLDNVSGVNFGSGSANVLALRADGSYGSEHWYGGAGLFREVQLVHTGPLAFVEQGVWLPPELALGANATFAVGEWENLGAAAAAATFSLALYDAGGARVASAASAPSTAQPGEVTLARLTLALPSGLPRWSGGSPALYTAVATLLGGGGQVLDARNFSAGFRATAWSAERGFSLNGQPLRQRGFSHHNSFAGAGVALPARLDLFRVQVSRALGANTWRMSHNPYRTALYDVLDAVGTLVWDENRDMGPAYVHQMHDMVKRGRNHAAVVVNSLCNEIECGSVVDARGVNTVGAAMVNLSKALDPTRPTTANSDTADGLGSVLDVQGLSHASVAKFEAAKAANPSQPLVLSECCSCSTQRAPRTFDYACMASQNAPGDLPYVTGSLGVWTLFDYYGEPPSLWPYVSSSFGQLDLAGFPKPHAYWYTANWRDLRGGGGGGGAAATARVLDLLDRAPGARGGLTATTSAATAELFADGASLGVQPANGSALFWALPRGAGNVSNATLVARDAGGVLVGAHTVLAPRGPPAALRLTLDVPSPATATGQRLLLDGHDVALVRCEVTDGGGALVSTGQLNVSFSVVSGPGRLGGVGGGDPRSHEQPGGAVVATFGGLARALVLAAVDCASAGRDRVRATDAEGALGPTAVLPAGAACPGEDIVLAADAPGLARALLRIPTSGDSAADGVLAVARASVGAGGGAVAYLRDFVG